MDENKVSEISETDAQEEPNILTKIVGKIPPFLSKTFFVYIALVILLIVFVGPFIDFVPKQYQANFSNLEVIPAVVFGALLTLGVYWLDKRFSDRLLSKRATYSILIVMTAILFAIQLYILKGCLFNAGWDVLRTTLLDTWVNRSEYFSVNQNNLFLHGLFVFINNVREAIGLDVDYYTVFAAIGCLFVAISICLASFVAYEFLGCVWAFNAFILMGYFIGTNPMILVPYSDAYGMLCPSIVLFAAFCIKNQPLRWSLICSFGYIGYNIKPTAIFIVVAIVVVSICRSIPDVFKKHSLEEYKTAAITVICASLSVILSVFVVSAIRNDSDVVVDDERSFTISHYLMMGINPETNGSFYGDDALFSYDIHEKEERQSENLKVWQERIASAGPIGIGELFVKKSLANYDSGIFSFLVEDESFETIVGDNQGLLDWYGIPYLDNDGIDPSETFWAAICQTIWISILIGIASLIIRRSNPAYVNVMAITLLLLSGFLLIFECRARYLYLFSPYFVILGIIGWRSMIEKVIKLIDSKKIVE